MIDDLLTTLRAAREAREHYQRRAAQVVRDTAEAEAHAARVAAYVRLTEAADSEQRAAQQLDAAGWPVIEWSTER